MDPEKAAQQLLSDIGLESPPVDVEVVAKHLGVHVERAEFGNDCSGVLVRKGESAMVGVHWGHHPNRQRFTIAHELGHFKLHSGGTYIDKSTTARFRLNQSGSGSEAEERQANQFAAALLMPAKWVRSEFVKRSFDLGDDQALSELCEVFQVSSQAMLWRLKNLKLLDHLA